jgi:hypothetical protein
MNMCENEKLIEIQDAVCLQMSEIEKEAWHLNAKLANEEYSTSSEQFHEMERIGHVARALRALCDARKELRAATSDTFRLSL